MKDSKFPPELRFRDLTQSDKDLVDKMLRGGSGRVSRRDALKLAMVTGVSLTVAEQLLTDGKAVLAQTRPTCTVPTIPSIRSCSRRRSTIPAAAQPITA